MLLQDRSHGIKARLLTVQSKRIVIHHEKQHFKEALDQASYHLNSSGMHIFYDTLKLMENRSHLLKLDEKDGVIIESYDGRFSKAYIVAIIPQMVQVVRVLDSAVPTSAGMFCFTGKA